MIRQQVYFVIGLFIIVVMAIVFIPVFSATSDNIVSATQPSITNPVYAAAMNSMPHQLKSYVEYVAVILIFCLIAWIGVAVFRREPRGY